MVSCGVWKVVDFLDLVDIIPNMRIVFALPCLFSFVGYAASAGEVDQKAWGRLLGEAGEDGGCAASMVDVSRICNKITVNT